MGSIENISELCRLCLVKDQVNVPIFEENASKEQTFVKINSCLPVKVSRDDSLPKKICDGCSCKLDMLYNFRNTSVDSEKQLLKWLNQADLSCSQSAAKDPLASTKPEIMIKQETFEPTDSRGDDNSDMGMDTHSYLMQQQKLPYPQEFEFGGPSESNVGLMTDEPAPKRAKRAAALNKAPIETDDDDLDAAMQITKAEEEDSEEIDQPDYVEAPSTSADDQPGPSGVGKASVEAPLTSTTNVNEIVCSLCQKTYLTRRRLRRHLKQHREKSFQCNLCTKCYLTEKLLSVHIKRSHDKQRNFFCSLCPFSSYTKYSLQGHEISVHTKNFPFKCDICSSGFLSKGALEAHRQKHDGKRFFCEICKKMFADRGNFTTQLRTHNPDYIREVFTCQTCRKVFRSTSSFKKHLRKHEGIVETFMCDLCGKKLFTREGFKTHKLIHSGVKSYICDYCGKTFSQRNTLRDHIRIHTKERPHVCNVCEKAFTQKSSLNRHMKQHTD
ncbi:zinc finger protein 26-like isoform X48 [Tribolium madens]|uniref:zinc finger protein 26-like isoform X48 n=1 Tax=Tribolium madens TaxID=41895 RepID=UPI001CF745C8|nr:zinc finger protein 26-like isoform X48 [Tribolium madens]